MLDRFSFFYFFYAFLICAIAFYFGQFQFGSYDLSPLIDIQYRLYLGQIPGVDFINTWPLSMEMILKLFNYLISPSWRSLLYINFIVFLFVALGIYLNRLPQLNNFKLMAILIFLSIPVVITNHFWHSTYSQFLAVFYLILSLKFFASDSKYSIMQQIVFIVVTGLLFFSKQNIGMPLIVLTCFGIIFYYIIYQDPKSIRYIILNLFAIFITGFLLKETLGIQYKEIIDSFLQVTNRRYINEWHTNVLSISPFTVLLTTQLISIILLLKWLKPSWSFYKSRKLIFLCALLTIIFLLKQTGFNLNSIDLDLNFIMIFFLYLFVITETLSKNPFEAQSIILLTALIASTIPIMTDFDIKYNDAPFFLTILLLGSTVVTDNKWYSGTKTYSCIAIIFLFLLAFYAGETRYRMKCAGAFYENTKLEKIETGYFSGLSVSPKMIIFRKQFKEAIAAQNTHSIFCGSRIEFCYADNNLIPPKKLPVWWHPGTSYRQEDESAVFNAFIQNNFDLVIFLKNDKTRIPKSIMDYIYQNYSRQDLYSEITLFTKK